MPRYAQTTEVPVERSRAEIEATLVRYKASAFSSGWQPGKAMIGFVINDLHIRFVLPIPDRSDKRFWVRRVRGQNVRATEAQAERAWDQEVRQRWRALCLVVKAKLEAVECGISTVEQEFLSFVVTNSGVTIGEWLIAGGRLAEITSGVTSDRLMLQQRQTTEEPQDVEGEVVP